VASGRQSSLVQPGKTRRKVTYRARPFTYHGHSTLTHTHFHTFSPHTAVQPRNHPNYFQLFRRKKEFSPSRPIKQLRSNHFDSYSSANNSLQSYWLTDDKPTHDSITIPHPSAYCPKCHKPYSDNRHFKFLTPTYGRINGLGFLPNGSAHNRYIKIRTGNAKRLTWGFARELGEDDNRGRRAREGVSVVMSDGLWRVERPCRCGPHD
jgi:hypothetical protein